jgi:hypothetical protein
LHDSYKGYHESADNIKSDSLRILLRIRIDREHRFACVNG